MEVEESSGCNYAGIRVSEFDYSVDNHFKAMDTISKLCEQTDIDPPDETEMRRLSSSITFLREWRHFCYETRTVRFACESDTAGGKDGLSGINLPQFSSAAVPKKDKLQGASASLDSSSDFVMYVGGSVWALDWCPRVHEKPHCGIKCEFVAVATHPPESYYHKLGAPLSGRGVVQIWCVLNAHGSEEKTHVPMKRRKQGAPLKKVGNDVSTEVKRPRGRPRKIPRENEAPKVISTRVMRARSQCRKKLTNESIECSNEQIQAVANQCPSDSFELVAVEDASHNDCEPAIDKNRGKKQKMATEAGSASNSFLTSSLGSRRLKNVASDKGTSDSSVCPPLLTYNENEESLLLNHQAHKNLGQDHVLDNIQLDSNLPSSSAPKDVPLPRLVLCLAHNGKVAWDVKWQPRNVFDSKSKYRMGYLAVLLGNGSLEVWDVPLPQTMRLVYSPSSVEGTDPRFVKLEPVFRCSILKCGDMQSIPLTLEWSTSHPHDYLLVGCHDGLVAMWKFSMNATSEDTRPLLCFSADTVPIRGVAWAPVDSDQESANVILTAGHAGVKFWDVRDPYRPLWDLHPAPKLIYSLDWLSDPRCIILSFDDGTMRLLSLVKAAYDAPVYGEPTVGPKQQGLHVFNNYSSSAIWSVQVSRMTGMVAYCSGNGTVYRFQLTVKAVEKDASRYRAPHFMCGSLSEDESAIIIHTPLPGLPLAMNRSTNDVGEDPKTSGNQVGRTNDKKSKGPASGDQTLGKISDDQSLADFKSKRKPNSKSSTKIAGDQTSALCYGDDAGVESDSEKTLAAFKSKRKLNTKSSSKIKAGDNQDVVSREEQDNIHEKEKGKGVTGSKTEAISPKIVAMHRVRWNMNKGSERWLCFGGAAGILRCQEIRPSDIG